MHVMYELTGYDRSTGRLEVSLDVPERRASLIKDVAGVPTTDDGLGSYPLNERQVNEIATILERQIDVGNREFFLEPYCEETPKRATG